MQLKGGGEIVSAVVRLIVACVYGVIYCDNGPLVYCTSEKTLSSEE